MAQLFWLSGQQLSDGNGAPHIAAKAWFYETGTTTPKATYSNVGLTSVNANPVVADANGRFGDIYLVAGRYKVVLTTSADVAIDTLDPVDATQQLFTRTALQGLPGAGDSYPFMRVVVEDAVPANSVVYRRNAANSAWITEGTADSLLNAADVSEVLTGTLASKAVTPDALAGLWQRGSDIPSNSTLSLPATGGGVFLVTGTTGISAISTGSGGRRVSLRFAGALTLTHSANLILPGAVNITTVAGDVADFINDAAQDATGSNWRCVNYSPAQGVAIPSPTLGSKSANYTLLDTDRGALIRFAGLGGAVTLSLPAAANRAGFIFHFVNDDTEDTATRSVTVDPNGAELIDGVATRIGCQGTRVTIMCDGTGWRTVGGTWRYFSGDQTITSGGLITLAHGFGVRPRNVWSELKCAVIEGNFAVGDVITYQNQIYDGASAMGYVATNDATNISVRLANNTTWRHLNKTTGAALLLTAATNWRLRIWAES